MKPVLALLSLACLLAGCESVHDFAVRHPVVSAVGVGVLAGSIALSANHGDSKKDPVANGGAIGPGPGCSPQPNGTCR